MHIAVRSSHGDFLWCGESCVAAVQRVRFGVKYRSELILLFLLLLF